MKKLNELTQQDDGVWAEQPSSAIEGFFPSTYLNDFKKNISKPSQTGDKFEEQLIFSPKRINLFRPFKWLEGGHILQIGSQSGQLADFLASQEVSVDIVESNRALAQLAAKRCQANHRVKVINHSIEKLDFESQKYDAIVLNGLSDIFVHTDFEQPYQQALKSFLVKLKSLLQPQGKIFLSADNRQGLKYIYGATDERFAQTNYGNFSKDLLVPRQSLNLHQWRSLVCELGFKNTQEYYLYPDYRFTSVILGENYCQNNPFAFQHLEGIQSKDYFQFHTLGVNEILMYEAANAHGHLGDFANSCLFILSDGELDKALDFVHLPEFNRQAEHSAIVYKHQHERFVTRQKLHSESGELDSSTEQHVEGCQLSVLWRNAILSDKSGAVFKQYLLEYFSFLKKLGSGVIPGMNIDAIANNVIVDQQGQYHLIDTEWYNDNEKVAVDFVFYRAVVHFALRNIAIFHYFSQAMMLTTLRDFVNHCLLSVGLKYSYTEVERLREQDLAFLSKILIKNLGYNFTDILSVPPTKRDIVASLGWSHDGINYPTENLHHYKAKTGHQYQQLMFKIDHTHPVKTLRFFPFDHIMVPDTGYIGLKHLKITAVSADLTESLILELATSQEIDQANLNTAAFFAEHDNEHMFLFKNNTCFFEFELPEIATQSIKQLNVRINFKLAPSFDYELARQQHSLIENSCMDELELRAMMIGELTDKLEKHSKWLDEMERSRIWRALTAYRDTFSITGYPQAGFLGKLKQFVYRFKNPIDHRKKFFEQNN